MGPLWFRSRPSLLLITYLACIAASCVSARPPNDHSLTPPKAPPAAALNVKLPMTHTDVETHVIPATHAVLKGAQQHARHPNTSAAKTNTADRLNKEGAGAASHHFSQYCADDSVVPNVSKWDGQLEGVLSRTSAADINTSSIRIYVYPNFEEFNSDLCKQLPAVGKDHQHRREHYWYLAGERYIHERLLKDPRRTNDPNLAHVFYVPYYTGCLALLSNFDHSMVVKYHRSVVEKLNRAGAWFKRNKGRDHVWFFSYDYGGCMHFVRQDILEHKLHTPPAMAAGIVMSTLGDRHLPQCHQAGRDIVVPPVVRPELVARLMALLDVTDAGGTATSIPKPLQNIVPRDYTVPGLYSRVQPSRVQEPELWTAHMFGERNRTRLIAWHGNPSSWHGIRQKLEMVLASDFGMSEVADVSEMSPAEYQDEMLKSHFCLVPGSWAPWSPRLVESMMTGCIPVVVTDEIILPFAEKFDWSELCIHIKEENIHLLGDILVSIPHSVRYAMRRNIAKLLPHFLLLEEPMPTWWGKADAYNTLIQFIAVRVKQHLGGKGSYNDDVSALPGGAATGNTDSNHTKISLSSGGTDNVGSSSSSGSDSNSGSSNDSGNSNGSSGTGSKGTGHGNNKSNGNNTHASK